MNNPTTIRVMIVDDHDMVRRGLATIFKVKVDLELAGEASNGQEALEKCAQVQPDVILMDLVMPEMDGASAIRAIRERYPHIQIIALTSFTERDLVQGALEAGAIGYLLKNVAADELSDAIRAAHAGRPTLAPEVAQVLRQAEKLERLTRAIVDAPPDASTLPDLLREHIPGMFADSRIEIRLFPEQIIVHHPDHWPLVPHTIWEWLRTSLEAHCFLPGAVLPWSEHQLASEGLVLMPITVAESTEPIGGIFVSRLRDAGTTADLLPVLKSLAAQISSALHSAQVYIQTMAQQKVARELAMAGQIQASFLPSDLPNLPGWQLAATLEPARETAGDFYDFIPLPHGQLGIVIADVADKGMGAALYMALSRTLIRTFATEYPTRPELVLGAASRRILTDARAGLFVTAFYGLLDPVTGTLTYCNAGHNPPYHLSARNRDSIQLLGGTGMALGVIEDTTWNQEIAQLDTGDVLLLYTDGIIEAQDRQGEFFGQKRLLETVQANQACSAQELQDALLMEVHQFMGDTPQFDDMTLLIVVRDS